MYQEDVRVWEVTKQKTPERNVGLWYLDPYARPGKRFREHGPNTYRSYTTFGRQEETYWQPTIQTSLSQHRARPLLVLLGTMPPPFFHEFGHALHFFASNVKVPNAQQRCARLHRVPIPIVGALVVYRCGDREFLGTQRKRASQCQQR